MSTPPGLLDQIIDLTAQRYIEVLEFSLLKTLHDAVKPSQLKVLKVDTDNAPVKEIEYRRRGSKVTTSGIKLEPELQSALVSMAEEKAKEASIAREEGLTAVYCLKSGEQGASYLLVVLDEALSEGNAELVSSLVQVYTNFFVHLSKSQVDQLTGLANRKTFDDTIAQIYELTYPEDPETQESKRSECPDKYWLAIIGIDQYETVINNFGHLYGEEVLLEAANIIKESFRENDMIFRFGGEEFVVIQRSQQRATCEVALKRLQENIAAHEFPTVGEITVSTGVTEIVKDNFQISLMDCADKALCNGDSKEKNRITFFEDIAATG